MGSPGCRRLDCIRRCRSSCIPVGRARASAWTINDSLVTGWNGSVVADTGRHCGLWVYASRADGDRFRVADDCSFDGDEETCERDSCEVFLVGGGRLWPPPFSFAAKERKKGGHKGPPLKDYPKQ